jgi:hypothetical protein
MKKKQTSLIIWLIILAGAGYFAYLVITAPKIPENELIARSGLHWHAHLVIKIKGENIEIPADIGVNGTMGAGGDPMRLHTHATDGIIHAEFAGLVRKEQLKLGHFFEIWGKDFSKDSILGHKTGEGGTVKMYVDGVENSEFENYFIEENGDYEYGAEKIREILITYE